MRHTIYLQRRWRPFLALPTLLTTLLVLASCSDLSQSLSLQPLPSPTATTQALQLPDSMSETTSLHVSDRFEELRRLRGPAGWMWQTQVPDHRLVVFYGNPLSDVMGPIGRYPDNELISRLHEQEKAYSALDPAHPTIAALDYVTPVAQPDPMDDGSYIYRMPASSIEHYITLANSNRMLFFFDMQIGHSPIQKEVKALWTYLRMPGVHLALDPEFDMPPGGIPSQVFGRMKAQEINWVIDQLAALVKAEHLPPKILIIHQFLHQMLPDWQKIKTRPEVQIITCVDGFGSPGEKIDDYRMFNKDQHIQYPGMKLFYALDKPLMSPKSLLALEPEPLLVMYQ